jgi:hypothetical protein
MMDPAARAARIFKTAWFTKAAGKARIADDELKHFRMHAEDYETLTDEHLVQVLDDEDLNEICNENAKVQE